MPRVATKLTTFAGTSVFRVCLVLLLLNVADGIVSTFASAYIGSLGYPLASIGLLVALYSIASLLSRMPAARLADGQRAHEWLLASCLVFAATLALYPVATTPVLLWAARLLHGVSFGVATTVNFARYLTVSTTPGASRTRATALYTASWSGGYSIGNLAAGLIADHLGYTPAFLMAAICPLAAAFVSPRVPSHSLSSARGHRESAERSWRVLLHAEVRTVPILAFCVNFLNYLLATLFPIYVLGIGQTLSLVGTARALQSLTNTFVRPIAAPLQRWGPSRVGSVGVAVSALAIAAIPLRSEALFLLGVFVVVGSGRAVGVVANASGTLDLSERGLLKRGTASALMTAGGDLGAVAAPLLSGVTASAIGLGPALQLLAIVTAVAGVAAMASGGARPALGRQPA